MTSATLLALAKRVLFFSIPIPVALILAAWAWFAWDKSSAVRKAVDAAIEKLVDGAELEAERARVKALQSILDERDRLAAADRDAIRKFADLLKAAETENGNLADEIADLESRPVNDRCVVDRPLLDRLR